MDLLNAITRVRELLAQRDDIERELSELLNVGPRPLTVRDRSEKSPPKPKTSKRACSACGKPGHNVMTCPQGKGTHPNNPKRDTASGDNKPERIRELLKEGLSNDQIALDCDTATSVVAFYRKQMVGRGELS
jgi:hypothetical protein